MSDLHLVLHNPYGDGNGMEVYPMAEAKLLLDRVVQLIGPLHDESKVVAGKLIDGRIDEVFKMEGSLKAILLSNQRESYMASKSIHVYLANKGIGKTA